MVAEILFEIAVCVFIFLVLGIVATIFEFKKFIHTQDKNWEKRTQRSQKALQEKKKH